MNRARIGLVLVGVGDLSGGGGAERFFLDFFNAYRATMDSRAFDLVLITDVESQTQLRRSGRHLPDDAVISLRGSHRMRTLAQPAQLFKLARQENFDLLHLSLALPRHLPWLWLLSKSSARARITVNVNDYELGMRLTSDPSAHGIDLHWRTTLAYLDAPVIDGFMVWYENLASQIRDRLHGTTTVVRAIRYFCVDTQKNRPDPHKANLVVCAGRFTMNKRMDIFLNAIALLRDRNPLRIANWEFLLLGRGPLEKTLLAQRAALGLEGIVKIGFFPDLSSVLSRSRLFISTQNQENFTSLAMLEAMAAGNAIVARDVGQTRTFVRPGLNGFLMPDDQPHSLAAILDQYFENPTAFNHYGVASRELTLSEHSSENVLKEFDTFWSKIIMDSSSRN